MPSSERMRDPYFRSRGTAGASVYGTNRPNFGTGKAPTGGGNSLVNYGDPLAAAAPPPVDIASILARNPYLQAANANRNAESIADKADRDARIRRAIIDFGYVPPNLVDFGQGGPGLPSPQDPNVQDISYPGQDQAGQVIDATTRELAGKNTTSGMSIWARLLDAAKIQSRDVVNAVGARGMFRSGETAYGLGRADLAANQGKYDAIKGLNDYIAGVQAAWAQAERLRQQQQREDEGKAIEEEPPPGEKPPPDPPPPGDATDYYDWLRKNGYATPDSPGNPVPDHSWNPDRGEGNQMVPPAIVQPVLPPSFRPVQPQNRDKYGRPIGGV